MLILYDTNHNKISALTNYKDYHIEQVVNIDSLLYFSYPIADSQYAQIAFECYIRGGSNEYIVKEINIQGADNGIEWAQIVCKINLEDLKGYPVSSFVTVEQKAEDAANLALAGTGWTVGYSDVTKLRTVKKSQCSVYDVLSEIAKSYTCEITYNAVSKTVNIHQKQGADRGVYFAEQLNLKQLQSQGNSNGYITRLIPIGKDGLDITSVNGGVNYVSNYQYSNKVITGYWVDNRYTVAQGLKDDAIERLAYLSKPTRAYSASIIDLANVSPEWGILDFALGDFITLLSESQGVREQQRIVKIDRYPEEPERSTIQIANRIARLEDIILKLSDAADIVGVATDTTGSIVASGVSGDLTNAYIPTANVGDLSVTLANMGTLIATKATITQLDATNANITILTASKANVTDLTAATGRIGTLEVNSATITQLNASTARITTLETTTAHITNGIIDNATIDIASVNNLSATYATIVNLTAANANITSLTTNVATINTLLAGNIGASNIQAGAIQAGSAIIADGAIGSAQILSLSASKLIAGTVDTSVVTIQGANGRLKITGNRLQVFAGTTTLYERVSLGDVNGDGTTYGFRVRGADGTTVLLDETGVKREGITDGSINNAKIGTDANISGTKLDIASVVTSINGGTTTIQGSKVFLNNSTLDVQFSAINTTVGAQGTTIASQGSSITALNNSIVLKVDNTTYNTKMTNLDGSISTINTSLSTQSSSISVLQGQITTKVTQTQVDTSINALQIGGRNLLRHSRLDYIPSGVLGTTVVKEIVADPIYGNVLHVNAQYIYQANYLSIVQDYKVGDKVKISFFAKATAVTSLNFALNDGSTVLDTIILPSIGTTWGYYTGSAVVSRISTLAVDLYFYPSVSGVEYWFKTIKVEIGDKATDWTPAPEDVQTDIDNSINANVNGRNIVTNGNFSNGTTGWTGAAFTVTAGICIYTVTAQYAGATQTIPNYANYKGHKLYVAADVKTNVTTNYLALNDGIFQLVVTHSGSNLFERLSGIQTISAVATALYVKVQDARTSAWTETQVDNFVVIDLTAVFGAGNEPTKAWCDANITFDSVSGNVQSQIDSATTRISTAETTITQNTNSITLKASQTSLDTTNSNVATAQTQANLGVTNALTAQGTANTANGTANTLNNTTVPALTTRVSTAESSLVVQANQIALKVTQTDVNNSVNAIQIGGRNLILDSQNIQTNPNNTGLGTATKKTDETIPYWRIIATGSSISVYENPIYAYMNSNCIIGNKYTISADVRVTSITSVGFISNLGMTSVPANIWTRINYTFTYTVNPMRVGGFTCALLQLDYRNYKLESGNKATDWTPAPEDVQSQLDLATTRISTAETTIVQNTNSITLKASQTSLDTTNGNVTTAQTQANLGVTNAALAQTQATLGVTNAATAQTQANTATTNAATAQTAANGAQTTANTAKAYTDNLALDSVITPDEKISLKREWDLIVVEGTATTGKIPVQATLFGVADTAFDTSYSALNTYLNTTLTLFTSMTIATTGIVRATWDTKWKDYYNARTDLLNAIAAQARTLANTAQTQANTGTANAATAQTQANLGVTNAATAQTAANLANTNATALTTRVTTAEASIVTQAGQITTKVTQTDINTSINVYKTLPDTRNDNQLPSWYYTNYPTQIKSEFKSRVTIGVSGAATYGTLTTSIPWTDASGGSVTQEFKSSDGVFKRVSTSVSAWGTWEQVENMVGSQAKVNLLNTNTVVPLTTRVTTAEATIVTQAGQITLKAAQTSLDTTNSNVTGVTTRMTTAEASITVQAGQISTKVDVAGVKSTIQQSATDVQIAFNAINAAKVTFDATGLVVDGGSYYIVEPGTQKLKTTVYSIPNLLADGSFEGILNYDKNALDILQNPPNLTYFDFNPNLFGGWYGWSTHAWSGYTEGSATAPYWSTNRQAFTKSEASNGSSMMCVNSTNYISQGVDLVTGQTYFISASHRQLIGTLSLMNFRSTSSSKIRIVVQWANNLTLTGASVVLDYASTTSWQRSGASITVPASTNGARIYVEGYDANWIYVDGVQLVQGGVAGKFDPLDDLWSHINGEIGFNHSKQQDWLTPTMLNGWVNYGSGLATCQYMKDSSGFVHLKGLVKNGTMNTSVFTLPVGYRPLDILHIGTASNNAYGQSEVYPSGDVWLDRGSNVWVSLSNVIFKAEQ